MGGLFQNVGRGQLMFEFGIGFYFSLGRVGRGSVYLRTYCLVGKVPGGGYMLDMVDGASKRNRVCIIHIDCVYTRYQAKDMLVRRTGACE